MLLRALGPAILVRLPRSRVVGVVYELIKRTTILGVESGLDSRGNIFGTSNDSDALHDNRLKNDHPIGVPFPSSYAVELHCIDGNYLFSITTK